MCQLFWVYLKPVRERGSRLVIGNILCDQCLKEIKTDRSDHLAMPLESLFCNHLKWPQQQAIRPFRSLRVEQRQPV
jgi:hypothetical protein